VNGAATNPPDGGFFIGATLQSIRRQQAPRGGATITKPSTVFGRIESEDADLGIAVETGIVMVVYLHEALERKLQGGRPLTNADVEAAVA
jgi:hypothetical protein